MEWVGHISSTQHKGTRSMSQQEPAFYNLEFFGDAAFWNGAGDVSRRTFLMPLSNPAEFLAFGVVGPSTTVHFVARGRVREHLGEFITRMVRDGATVELYARPPLPWHLVKRYASDEPYESVGTDGPRDPPVNGFMGYGGGAAPSSLLPEPISSGSLAWPSGTETTRKVVIMPANNGTEFLAFGVCSSPDLFVFLARGWMGEPLASFTERVTRSNASVERCDWPSQSYLQAYITKNASLLSVVVPTLTSGTEITFSDNQAAASAF